MSLETPARIAIVGAGPLGLEAALYARFLGYEVDVYEQGEVGHYLKRQKDEHMPASFAESASPLGLAALAAQDAAYQPPSPDARLTTDEFLAQYLRPLADTDLLRDHVQCSTRVVRIEPEGLNGSLPDGSRTERDVTFQLSIEGPAGQRQVTADAVLDASGVGSGPSAPDASAGLSNSPQQHGGAGSIHDDVETRLYFNLTLMLDGATGALPGLAAKLATSVSPRVVSGLDLQIDDLRTGEPHLFILGSKSFGRCPGYTLAIGLEQIRVVFAHLAGRHNLDLYANMRAMLG